MKKILIAVVAACAFAGPAFAFDPVGPVDTRGTMAPDHSKVPLAKHETAPACGGCSVDTRAVLGNTLLDSNASMDGVRHERSTEPQIDNISGREVGGGG